MMYDMRGCGFTALTGLTQKTSFLGYEPKNNYFFFFPVYDVNKCMPNAAALGR